jgi:hypothetical protein
MFLPIMEAYWAVAIQAQALLPVCGADDGADDTIRAAQGARALAVDKAVVKRLHANVQVLYSEGLVVHAEALSTELVANAISLLQKRKVLATRPARSSPVSSSPTSAPSSELCVADMQALQQVLSLSLCLRNLNRLWFPVGETWQSGVYHTQSQVVAEPQDLGMGRHMCPGRLCAIWRCSDHRRLARAAQSKSQSFLPAPAPSCRHTQGRFRNVLERLLGFSMDAYPCGRTCM